jgi:hypothetical protein
VTTCDNLGLQSTALHLIFNCLAHLNRILILQKRQLATFYELCKQ